MKILYEKEIRDILSKLDPAPIIREGFIAYSEGKCVVPPVGELCFKDPPGDVHIKYGYIENEDYYVIKIASGFFKNEKLGIPNGQGMMLVFRTPRATDPVRKRSAAKDRKTITSLN